MDLVVSSPSLAPTQEGHPRLYRTRNPERTAFYQLFDKHFDDYIYAYEQRFEPKAGTLRPVVRPTVEAFLDCGRLYGGFARVPLPFFRRERPPRLSFFVLSFFLVFL